MKPPPRILIVDDEAPIRQFLTEFLTLHHYDVVTASSGPEALGHAKARGIALVLLDVLMPDMDGWQVLAQLKHDEATRSIPVIMLTGQGGANALMDSQRLGATDHLIKPFNPDALLAILRRCL